MSTCIITSGIGFGCPVAGGVKTLRLANYDSDTQYTFGDGSTDPENLIIGATAAPDFYLIESDIEFAGLNQTIEVDRSNGSFFVETTITLKVINFTNEVRNFMISAGRAPLVALVESNSGEFALAGVESPGRVDSGEAGFGVEFSDMNGLEMNIIFRSQAGVYFVDPDIVGTDLPLV